MEAICKEPANERPESPRPFTGRPRPLERGSCMPIRRSRKDCVSDLLPRKGLAGGW